MNVDIPDLPAQVLADQCHLTVPSLPNWIEPAVEYLCGRAVQAGACQESRAPKLMLALHEGITNAVIHGNLAISSELKERGDHAFAQALAQRSADAAYSDRIVDVTMDYDGDRCRFVITDEGNGFNVDQVMARVMSDDPEVLLASGRGIVLMKSFLDEVKYENGGRSLILSLRRPSGEEKRRHPRVGMNQPVRVAPILPDGQVDWNQAYEAISRNLSEGGVAVLQEKLAQTDRVLIGILLNGQMVYLPAEVRHCRNLDGDLVELGCSFAPPKSAPATANATGTSEDQALAEAIAGLLRERRKTLLATDERRVHQRIVYNERIGVTTPGGEVMAGFARDLSRGGMAFITTRPLALENARVHLPHEEGKSFQILCRVVRCFKVRDELFDVGVRFLKLEKEN